MDAAGIHPTARLQISKEVIELARSIYPALLTVRTKSPIAPCTVCDNSDSDCSHQNVTLVLFDGSGRENELSCIVTAPDPDQDKGSPMRCTEHEDVKDSCIPLDPLDFTLPYTDQQLPFSTLPPEEHFQAKVSKAQLPASEMVGKIFSDKAKFYEEFPVSGSKSSKGVARYSCNFCRRNPEWSVQSTQHQLRHPRTGIVVCPVLRSLVCPHCQATGDRAHTAKYCPYQTVKSFTINSTGQLVPRKY